MSRQAICPDRSHGVSDRASADRRAEDRDHLLVLLDERLRFESLLARLSATFIHLPANEVDGQIQRGLQQIVEFLAIERSSLGQFLADCSELVVTHSYTVPGFAPFPRLNIAPLWPWYTAQLRRGGVLRFTRLPEELPLEAVHEREFYARQQAPRSHVAVPFKVGTTVLGCIGYSSFRREIAWPDDVVQGLQLVGEVFANALARKRAEEREARLREQLTRVARVTTLGELAASIAHEVNQPLCAIVSNAETAQRLLGKGHVEVEEIREALQDISEDGRRASAVIARVRASLQKGPVERAPVDVNDLLREVAGLSRSRLALRGLGVRLDLAAGLPPVLGDRFQLQQVILNLLANGADAMDGVIGEPRELVLRSAGDGAGGVAVAVEDAGVGLDPADVERVFEALFTTKPAGMGMGLAICRSIIEAHGGRIEALPNAGAGATFRLTLPGSPLTLPSPPRGEGS
jgi:signal transduction histidine kinase